MPSHVRKLYDKKIAHCPPWLPDNVHFECMMGSVAYGVSSDSSDTDLYGFAIPPKDEIFPHLRGLVPGFDTPQRFQQWQEHHLFSPDDLGGKGRNYDCSIYNIVDFFRLCMDNNPNMIDSLFVPEACVLHITRIGQIVRDNRKMFLSKASWHRFKGYAYQQLHKAKNKAESPEMESVISFENEHNIPRSTTIESVKAEVERRNQTGKRSEEFFDHSDETLDDWLGLMQIGMTKTKRFEGVKIHTTDTKFLYHVVRLLDEAEQIMETGDLDLTRAREQMKAVRRGEMTEQDVRDFFEAKSNSLTALYDKCTLPWKADTDKVRELLLNCLEEHYGNLNNAVVRQDQSVNLLRQIHDLLETNRAHFKD